MSIPWIADVEYEEYQITDVREEGNSYVIEVDGAWLAVDKSKFDRPPEAGQTARYFGRGFGFPVRGLVVDGVEIYYETDDDYRIRTRAEQIIRESSEMAEADARRGEIDARVAALPECFQGRIHRFRANNSDFYWRHEGYEMSACVDAVRIAHALGDASRVSDFHALPWDEQKAAVPDLEEGHSGNTFGMACRLAHHYLTDERLVFAEHAAIAALVGCDEAGCPPVTDDEMVAAGYAPFPRAAPEGTGGNEP
jgi:hypothetical protein